MLEGPVGANRLPPDSHTGRRGGGVWEEGGGTDLALDYRARCPARPPPPSSARRPPPPAAPTYPGCHPPVGLRLLQELHLLVHAGTGLQFLHHHLSAENARAHLPQEHLQGHSHRPPWIRRCSLYALPYSSAKCVPDPSPVNPPGCNIAFRCSQHSLGVRSEEEGGTQAGGGPWRSRAQEAAPCALPPTLLEASHLCSQDS